VRAPQFWWGKRTVAADLMGPLAALYGAVAAKRLALSGVRIGIPVLCVGNPTVGGAGKTPTAIALARLLIAAGERPVFLSRGYGGRLAGPELVDSARHTSIDVGDEPLLLARVAPTVAARGRRAGAFVAKDIGASVIVMDDGFQNPSIEKNLSILVIDGRRGVGNGRVLPAGPLRAPLGAQLDRAQAILVIGDCSGAAEVVAAAHMRPVAVFHGRLQPDPKTVAAFAGTRVLAFAGIGDPERFFSTLAAAGIDAPIRRAFPDHHRYTGGQAAALLVEAERQNLRPLTTEKDLARMARLGTTAALLDRARALPINLVVDENDRFRQFVFNRIGKRC
jgi:tetraacyldisaccharide 4'-kinase